MKNQAKAFNYSLLILILLSHLSYNFLCTNHKGQYNMHILSYPFFKAPFYLVSFQPISLLQSTLLAPFSWFQFYSHFTLKCIASNHFSMASRVLVLSLRNTKLLKTEYCCVKRMDCKIRKAQMYRLKSRSALLAVWPWTNYLTF